MLKVLFFSTWTADCVIQILKEILEFEVIKLQICYKLVGSHSNSTLRGSDDGTTHRHNCLLDFFNL